MHRYLDGRETRLPFRRRGIFTISIFILGAVAGAQTRPPAPEQSPRKALLEMLNGGEQAIRKHLTLEVQKKLGEALKVSEPGNMNPLQALSMARAAGGENVEGFEAGPVLFAYDNPGQHQKLEVRIDGEEMRGGEDQMRLSVHAFRDGVEEDLPVALRFTLSWKAQQNLWRLNAVTVSVTVPVGDPRLFDKTKWPVASAAVGTKSGPAPTATATAPREAAARLPAASTTAISSAANPSADSPFGFAAPSDASKMTPLRAVRLIGMAENIYAQKHPDAGFTCELANLINVGRGIDDGEPYRFMDPEFAQGVYNGYRFSLTGCSGAPARSFQVIAEPLNAAGRAYCSDASREVRGSDDGNGLNCLASGKIVQR